MRATTMVLAVLVLAGAAGTARALTHAPWPADWNNWNDPALLVTVGNPGNAADDTGFGPVDYTFRMGKFEVTAGQYTAFLNAVAATDTHTLYNAAMGDLASYPGCNIQRGGLSGGYTYSVGSNWANRPVSLVSWADAARFANWLTNGQPTGAQDLSTTEDGSYLLNGASSDAQLLAVTRKASARWVIPTEEEWYKAAYHKNDGVTGNYWNYPTGTDSVPRNDLVDPDTGDNANFIPNDGGYTIGGPYWRTEVGEFENSKSPYGTFDQGGNVWEWTELIVGSHPVLRGGSYAGGHDPELRADSGRYISGGPTGEGFHIGFRVVEVPEPAALSLLVLAGLAIVRRRRLA